MSLSPAYPVTTPTPIPSSQVIVNQESDLPAASGGIITLEDNKHYHIGAAFSSANKVTLGANNVITMGTSLGPLWTYTGTGTFFTGTDVTVDFHRGRFSCPNADFVAMTDTAPHIHTFLSENLTVVACQKFATFTDLRSVATDKTAALSCTDGISFGGSTANAVALIDIERTALISAEDTFVGLDLGTAIFATIEIVAFLPIGPAASTAMSGLASSANIVSGSVAQVIDSEFGFQTTPLSGLTRSDIRWNFINNEGVSNSTNTADTHVTITQLVTIGGGNQGVFLPIAGTNWLSDIAERFTATTAGVLTYIAEKDAEFQVTGIATIEKASGGSDQLCMRISINGTSQDFTQACTENNAPSSVTCLGLFSLSPGDEIRLDVANVGSTGNINVLSANMSIINGF